MSDHNQVQFKDVVLRVKVDAELYTKFSKVVFWRHRLKKGGISLALVEAISEWVKSQEQRKKAIEDSTKKLDEF